MKTTITTVLLALSLCLNSQVVTLLKTDTIVCPGDSIHISFKWDYKPLNTQFTAHYNDTLKCIWQYSYVEFYKMKKSLSKGDTIYHTTLRTDAAWGIARIWLGVMWKNTRPVDMSCTWLGIDTGVDELKGILLEPKYFDLNGNRTEKQTGKILIEQIGNIRRKILILE